MIVFSQENYSDKLVQEMMPLWAAHHAEIPQLKTPLEPDLRVYQAIESNGGLRVFTVRHAESLVGYQVFFVAADHHSKNQVQAVQDILYLAPEYRGTWHGYKFIQWCDARLGEEGVNVSVKRIDSQHDFGRMLERMGYTLVDLTYARRLNP